MATETTIEQMTTPPFPEKMSFREMYDGLFNRDFLSQEEFRTICDAAEMYANGCIREYKSKQPSSSVEDAATEFNNSHSGNCSLYSAFKAGASWQASHPTPVLGEQDEKILCAAIWFDDGRQYNLQPKNIKSGVVLCGWRHGCIFPQIGGTVGERQKLGIYEKEQGFLTSKNRFVDRQEAAEIAIKTNQFKDKKEAEEVRKTHYLYSENIY